MSRAVIGIDPGIDVCGVAMVGLLDDRRLHVHRVLSVRTASKRTHAERLADLHAALLDELNTLAEVGAHLSGTTPTDPVIAVEHPTHVGRSAHARRQGGETVNARSMSQFWQALGAVYVAAAGSGLQVISVPPGGMKKTARQELFAVPCLAGRNADERDAIVVACTQLLREAPVRTVARTTAR